MLNNFWRRLGAQRALEKVGVSTDEARDVGRKLKVNFKKYPLGEFRQGIEDEFEHTTNKLKAGRIALDHMSEYKGYYPALNKLQNTLKKQK